MRLYRRGATSGTRRLRPSICFVAALTLAAALTGCGEQDQTESAGGKAGGNVPTEPVVLRMINPLLETSSAVFVDQVEKVSNGQLRIEPIDRWNAYNGEDIASRERAAIDAAATGEYPLAMTTAVGWHDHGVRSFDALLPPMLIDRPEVQTAVLHSDIATEMLAGLDGSGLTGVGILPGRMSLPGGISHPLTDVADYRGAVVALLPNAVTEKWLTAMGAVSRGFVSPDEVEAGAVAGYVDDASKVSADLATSLTTNVAVGPKPVVVFGNTAAMAALSDQNRTFLQDAVRSSVDIKARNDQTEAGEAAVALCRGGTMAFEKADSAQLAALRASAEPVYQWLREDGATAGFLDRIQQIADATPVDPVAAAALDCPSTASTSTTSATTTAAADAQPTAAGPLDGTYSSSLTKEQTEAAGLPPANSGEWVVVLGRGWFATTQQHDQDCTWAYGHFFVDADSIRLEYEGGNGVAPPPVIHQPGDVLAFRWSLYRDVLSLTNQPAVSSPLPAGAQWDLTRTSTTPDVSALNQQCPPPGDEFPN